MIKTPLAQKDPKNMTLAEQEKAVLDKLVTQRNELAKLIVKPMNKNSIKENTLVGLFQGTLLGIIFGLVTALPFSDAPVRNESGRVIEYKKDLKQFTKIMLISLAGTMLLMLLAYGVATSICMYDNRNTAKELSSKTFKKTFGKVLQQYIPKDQKYSIPDDQQISRIKKASALILAHMSKKDMENLRKIAMSGITCNNAGIFTISEEALNKASELISDFIGIGTNAELACNVIRIMRGDNPLTYCIKRQEHQYTR